MSDLDPVIGENDDEIVLGLVLLGDHAFGKPDPQRHLHLMGELSHDVAHEDALALADLLIVNFEEIGDIRIKLASVRSIALLGEAEQATNFVADAYRC